MGPARIRGGDWADAENCWGQGGNLQTTFRREQEVPLHLWDCRRLSSWPVWTCLSSHLFRPARIHSPSNNEHHNDRASSGFMRLRKRRVGLEMPRPEHRSIGGTWMYGMWGPRVQVWGFFEENKFPDVTISNTDDIYVCRVCGGDPYPPCTGTSDNDKTTSFTDMTTSGTQPTESTNVPTGDCSSCGGSEWSSPCLEVGFQSKNCLPFVLCLEMTLVWYLSTKLLGHFPEICVQPGTFSWGLVFKNNHIPFFQKKYFLAGYWHLGRVGLQRLWNRGLQVTLYIWPFFWHLKFWEKEFANFSIIWFFFRFCDPLGEDWPPCENIIWFVVIRYICKKNSCACIPYYYVLEIFVVIHLIVP